MTENAVVLSPNNLSTVSFAVGFNRGAAAEDIRGISEILTSHLTRNTENKDEAEFAKHLDYYGIVPFSNVSRTGMWIGFNTPPQNLNIALDTLREVLFEPSFSEETIKKLVQQQKGSIAQMEQIPQAKLFQSTRWEAAFGTSRVARHPMGTIEDLEKITVKNLNDYYNDITTYQPKLVSIGIHNSKDSYKDLIADLDSFGNKKSSVNMREDKVKPLNLQIDKMQATSQNAYVGINIISQGYNSSKYEDEIFDNVLSGGFSSKLFMEIRDKRNLSYGVFSLNSKFDEFGLITVGMDIRPDRVEEGLTVALQVIKDTLTDEIPEDELQRALKAAQQTALFVTDSSQQYTNYVMSQFVNNREWDLDKINEKIKSAVELDWQAHMAQFFKKDNLSLGIAGESGNAEESWEEIVEKVI